MEPSASRGGGLQGALQGQGEDNTARLWAPRSARSHCLSIWYRYWGSTRVVLVFLLLLFENRFCRQDFKKCPLLECTQSNRNRACLAQSSLVSEEPTSCSAVPEALFKGNWEKELQGIHDRVSSPTFTRVPSTQGIYFTAKCQLKFRCIFSPGQ